MTYKPRTKRYRSKVSPEKKIIKDLRVSVPPLTSETQFKKTQREINALNKKRSEAMELRIAKYLRGRRTPSSGAMAKYKGDVEIPLQNYPGSYVVECKLSGQTEYDKPYIALQFDWITKIEKEAKDMNMKFGILIIHFQGNNNDYVIMTDKVAQLLIDRYNTPHKDRLIALLNLIQVDWATGKGSKKVFRHVLDAIMNNAYNGAHIKHDKFSFIVVTLQDFKAFVEHM